MFLSFFFVENQRPFHGAIVLGRHNAVSSDTNICLGA